MKYNKHRTLIKEKVKSIREFTSDGCTMSPDMTHGNCCIEHDLAYRFGLMKRSKADKNLRKCIALNGHPFLCWIYWIAVRIFGKHYFNQKKYLENKENK